MLDPKRLQQIAHYNEKRAAKLFKKMGYTVTWLDRQGKRKRPEFLVKEPDGPLLVCEVKTVFSGGYLSDRGAHISALDPALIDSGLFSFDIDLRPMSRDLTDACEKYRVLVEDEPDLGNVPLLVVFFFDHFADNFMFYPRDMIDHPEASGIATIQVNRVFQEHLDALSDDALYHAAMTGSTKGFPPASKEFNLVLNESAAVPLPKYFVDACYTEWPEEDI